MKMRLLLTLAGLAIGFAVPALAQEKEEVNPFPFRAIPASPQIVQQLEAINLKFDEALNKHDAAAVAALFTANAIQVTPVECFPVGKPSRNFSQICFSVSVLRIDLQKSVMSVPSVAIYAQSEDGL